MRFALFVSALGIIVVAFTSPVFALDNNQIKAKKEAKTQPVGDFDFHRQYYGRDWTGHFRADGTVHAVDNVHDGSESDGTWTWKNKVAGDFCVQWGYWRVNACFNILRPNDPATTP